MGSRRRRLSFGEVVRDVRQAFVEHSLLTYAAAASFQAILALIPLFLLGLALLGALGLGHVWDDSLAPPVRSRVTEPVYHAIDFTGRRIVSNGTAGTIVFAGLLSAWYLTAAVRVVMEALNTIHDVEDTRPWWRRALVAVGLAVVVGVALVTSFIVASAGGGSGVGGVLLGIGRWLLAIVLLGVAVGLLVRLAPAEHPQARWASAGSALVIVCWLVGSLVFRWWITTVVDFRSPAGSLAGLLALGGYVFMSVGIFLVGAQLDETLRRDTGGRARGMVRGWF